MIFKYWIESQDDVDDNLGYVKYYLGKVCIKRNKYTGFYYTDNMSSFKFRRWLKKVIKEQYMKYSEDYFKDFEKNKSIYTFRDDIFELYLMKFHYKEFNIILNTFTRYCIQSITVFEENNKKVNTNFLRLDRLISSFKNEILLLKGDINSV